MAVSEKILKHRCVFDEQHPTHDPPGIEDFDVLKPISKGAFGEVYMAKRRGRDKLYAIKVMKKIDLITKNMMQQVLTERDAFALSSKCPYVVPLYYSFQSKDNMFLVMDYMIGGDVKSILHFKGYFEEDMAKFYIGEVTLAIEYLHKHTIYHRDIKPDNMLISHNGHVKLTDFGLSVITSKRKPNISNLVTKTPDSHQSSSKKLSSIFWRTPGQLLSLTSKFTFSAPKDKRIPQKYSFSSSGSAGKVYSMDLSGSKSNSCTFLSANENEFEFCSPELINQGSYIYDTKRVRNIKDKKVLFVSNDDCDHLKSLNMKRSINMCEDLENENTPPLRSKRVRISLPIELEYSYDLSLQEDLHVNPKFYKLQQAESYENNMGINVIECNKDSSMDKMSVDASVFHDNSDVLSGVTSLSETSLISTKTQNVFPRACNESLSKLIENDDLGQSAAYHCIPMKKMDIESSSNVISCGSVSSIKSQCNKVDTSYNEIVRTLQTPLRSPKSCIRGNLSVTDKRVLGTPDYLAPEILLGDEFGPPADWWALGVCFYEFVTGIPPFNDDTPDLVFEHILDNEYIFPSGNERLDVCTEQTIALMLTPNPNERPNACDIKNMACFSKLNWDNLSNEVAPFIPKPDDAYDTAYFFPKNLAYDFRMSDFKI